MPKHEPEVLRARKIRGEAEATDDRASAEDPTDDSLMRAIEMIERLIALGVIRP